MSDSQVLEQILKELKAQSKQLENLATAVDAVEAAVWGTAPEG